jgi:hypothetical protein
MFIKVFKDKVYKFERGEMIMCFIKKIFEGKQDDLVHRQFVRFGKGTFKGRAAAGFRKTGGRVKLNFGFEYVNDVVRILCDLKNIKFLGMLLSKEELPFKMIKGKDLKSYEFSGDSQDLKSVFDRVCYALLDSADSDIMLKTKKKLPKPGKSDESKIDTKFCQLELPEKYWPAFKNCFFWDFPEDKKGSVMHTYVINEIIMPENEKDFEKIRVMAKRKGKIIRKISDGTERLVETAMTA